MQTKDKILTGVCSGLFFFLSAFYYKVDAGLQEMSQINTTLAVAVSEMKNLDKRVESVEDSIHTVETDVKKLSDGFISLRTRVGYLEK